MITVSDLWLYPVKSLRGFRVKRAQLTPLGFQWDRHWMLIDDKGTFLTQRKLPQMVLIKTMLSDSHLILSKKGLPDYAVPLHYPKTVTTKTASIWKDQCNVIFEEPAVNRWLQQALDITSPVFLVRMHKDGRRTQSKAALLGDNTHTLFADAAPFLITTNTSLMAINQALLEKKYEPVTMEHFRPNIVLDGIGAFAEHSIKRLTHSHYTFEHRYPCQRCIVPTIDINTALPHQSQEPFMTLMGINTMPGDKKAPAFGENAILIEGENHDINIGDALSAHPL